MRTVLALLMVAALAPAARAGTPAFDVAAPTTTTGFEAAPVGDAGDRSAAAPAPAPAWGSPLALELDLLAARPMSGDPNRVAKRGPTVLSTERAQALLRSLTIPGWGQASLGRTRSATFFGILEAGVWATFAAFKVQEGMRVDNYLNTAERFAGVDLSGRSDEYRRMVGSYPSSDDYNKYVVYRDAANLYYDDPAAMAQYIESHSIRDADGWRWVSPETWQAYQDQRKDAQQAALHANTALAVAIANRIVSALHAARAAGHPKKQGWRLEVRPDDRDPLAFEMALRTSF